MAAALKKYALILLGLYVLYRSPVWYAEWSLWKEDREQLANIADRLIDTPQNESVWRSGRIKILFARGDFERASQDVAALANYFERKAEAPPEETRLWRTTPQALAKAHRQLLELLKRGDYEEAMKHPHYGTSSAHYVVMVEQGTMRVAWWNNFGWCAAGIGLVSFAAIRATRRRRIAALKWRCDKTASHVFPRYAVPRCPFCGAACSECSLDGAPERGIALRLAAGIFGLLAWLWNWLRSPTLARVTSGTESYFAKQDFVGYGNYLLDVMLRGSQEERASGVGLYFSAHVRQAIERKFKLPAGLAYGQPHRDEHVPAELRDAWKEQEFPQLIIFAYVLGGTRRTLPWPHDQLVPYYVLMSNRQTKSIERARSGYVPPPRQPPPPGPSPAEVQKKIAELIRSGMTPEGAAAQIAKKLAQPRGRQ